MLIVDDLIIELIVKHCFSVFKYNDFFHRYSENNTYCQFKWLNLLFSQNFIFNIFTGYNVEVDKECLIIWFRVKVKEINADFKLIFWIIQFL